MPVVMGPKRSQRRHLVSGLPCRRLGLVAPTIRRRLIGDARVVRAVGKARERLAAAEEEVGAARIADRPMAGVLGQFQKRLALAHRHDVVEGDRIGLDLHLEGMGERGVAARDRTRDAHHVLGWTCLARTRHG